MYTTLLIVHSYLRWLVLAAAIVAIVRALGGSRAWTSGDQAASRAFIVGLDLQLLIGLVLYAFLSPFTGPAWSDMAATMRNAPLRSMIVEHPVGMIVAAALAHIGWARAKKRTDPRQRHRTVLLFFVLALVVIVLSIPWPFMPGGRPLLRGLTDVG